MAQAQAQSSPHQVLVSREKIFLFVCFSHSEAGGFVLFLDFGDNPDLGSGDRIAFLILQFFYRRVCELQARSRSDPRFLIYIQANG